MSNVVSEIKKISYGEKFPVSKCDEERFYYTLSHILKQPPSMLRDGAIDHSRTSHMRGWCCTLTAGKNKSLA